MATQPTAVTPGQMLTLNNGFDITSTGGLSASTATAKINDATSGNFGGTLSIGSVHVGADGDGTFTQSGGVSVISSLTAGGNGHAGNIFVTAGNLTAASPVAINGGALFRQTAGKVDLGEV